MMNYMRQIEIAPGITLDAKDLTRELREVVVSHFAAGNAVLTLCSISKADQPREAFWQIETSFQGLTEETRRYDRLPNGNRMPEIDDALAYLVVLGAQWMARQPEMAVTIRVAEVMAR